MAIFRPSPWATTGQGIRDGVSNLARLMLSQMPSAYDQVRMQNAQFELQQNQNKQRALENFAGIFSRLSQGGGAETPRPSPDFQGPMPVTPVAGGDYMTRLRSSLPELFSNMILSGYSPANAAAAVRMGGTYGGANNDELARLHVGAGGGPFEPNASFTVDRQNQIRADNQGFDIRKLNIQEAGANARNKYSVDQREAGDNARFERQRAADEARDNRTLQRYVDDGGDVRWGRSVDLPGRRAESQHAPARSAAENDVSPSEADKLGILVEDALGVRIGPDKMPTSDSPDIPPEVRTAITARASELYKKSRDAGSSVRQAVDEMAERYTVPGKGWFSSDKTAVRLRQRGGEQPAPPRDTSAPPALRPGVTIDGYTFKGGDPNDKANWVPEG